MTYDNNIKIVQETLPNLPKFWDTKTCVLELKEADYQWRQMEFSAYSICFNGNFILLRSD